jgi:hypothetical protein
MLTYACQEDELEKLKKNAISIFDLQVSIRMLTYADAC